MEFTKPTGYDSTYARLLPIFMLPDDEHPVGT